ncbi:MAG: DEAD/DEAH box helicase, partial [Coprococcus sp.]
RFAPQLNVCMVTGTQKERSEKLKHYGDYDVLVTSYDLLKRDIAEYEECSFLCQVLDEAQFIKNHTTAAAKAVKLIHSKTRYALTGTPIENRLSEMWSIFDFLMPGFLYGYDVFKKEIETPIVKNQDKDAMERLKRMVSPFILRRLKKDVLKDLPDKLEKVHYAKFDNAQQKLYDGQVTHMQMMLEQQQDSDFGREKLKILAELTRIRQICCDPSLIYENYKGGSAKREACMELIHQGIEGEHRMLIFSQFTSMLELLEKELDDRRIPYYKITGETPKEKRIQMVHDFNEGDTPVFLISLKAGGTGLNLTGADMVIHYDPWWNLAVQNQATDRAHRIGQTNTVTVYKLIAKDSVEEKILKMQEKKKDLAEEILSGETGGLSALSKEELLELLSL